MKSIARKATLTIFSMPAPLKYRSVLVVLFSVVIIWHIFGIFLGDTWSTKEKATVAGLIFVQAALIVAYVRVLYAHEVLPLKD